MIRVSRLPSLLLIAVLFLTCATALVGVDCGSNADCATSKLALGYLLLGVVVVFMGPVVWSLRALVARFALAPIPVFSPNSVFPKLSARAPPALL
jgi:hypothetical protein